MAKKNNLKSVRLSDQVMDYVINFEGDGFNQKFENLVLFCMEQEETKKQKIAFLDQQIVKQYKKLDALRKISSEIGDVRKALTNLEWRANDLFDLMDKLLEDKDADPELPFFQTMTLHLLRKKMLFRNMKLLVLRIRTGHSQYRESDRKDGKPAG